MAAPPGAPAAAPASQHAPLPHFKNAKYVNKRIDLPAEAYVDLSPYDADESSGNKARVALTTKFARRPKFNTSGDLCKVGVNQFRVTAVPFDKDIWQFDVSAAAVGTRKTKPGEPIKDIVLKKCWESKVFQAQLKTLGYPVIYDGAKLAWAVKEIEIKCIIDLDVDKGQKAREDKTNEFRFHLRPTKKIRLASLTAYLGGKMTWDTSVTESMNFLDHLIRQGPSENFKLIKRSFFNNKSTAESLGTCIEAVKGIYSAIRMNESISAGLPGLGINVDVSNQAFWIGQPLIKLALNFVAAGVSGRGPTNENELARDLKPIKGGPHGTMPSPAFLELKRLCRLRFVTTHRKDGKNEEYTIFTWSGGPQYGPDGATAHTVKFDRRDPKDPSKVTKMSIYDYYLSEFKIKLAYPGLPLVQTGKGAFFPMEVCRINRLNSYPFKLDGNQTTAMLKFAVKRPGPRKDEILKCVQNLGWDKDPYLKSFGLAIDPKMPMVPGKVLKPPKLMFSKTNIEPRFTGRWMLANHIFSEPNRAPLRSWAIGVFEGSADSGAIAEFAKKFATIYRGHGGRFESPSPYVANFTARSKEQYQVQLKQLFNDTGGKFKCAPQILFLIVRSKVSQPYEVLKSYGDTMLGIPTQVLLGKNVQKADGQYISNVCMKVNAKLGGTTNRAVVVPPSGKVATPLLPPKTAMIGVDVSHSAPGAPGASLASLCLSMDKDCVFYTGAVQTNGYRTEILEPANVHGMLEPLLRQWILRNKVSGPENIFYFRDGVSEGQFAHVIDYELAEMRKVFQKVMQRVPKITVIVATKRHHIRFFPDKGDKNANALPGTLVEKEVTHPFHYDFYLCSHVAIQGTARPVHYHVLHDEVKMTVDDLQRMIYLQCYQYVRSTTPVSLHPAVYYAHLAGNRGRCHETQGSAPQPLKRATSTTSTVMPPPPPLMAMGREAHPSQVGQLQQTMWYI